MNYLLFNSIQILLVLLAIIITASLFYQMISSSKDPMYRNFLTYFGPKELLYRGSYRILLHLNKHRAAQWGAL